LSQIICVSATLAFGESSARLAFGGFSARVEELNKEHVVLRVLVEFHESEALIRVLNNSQTLIEWKGRVDAVRKDKITNLHQLAYLRWKLDQPGTDLPL
jgi:hypothetical protein